MRRGTRKSSGTSRSDRLRAGGQDLPALAVNLGGVWAVFRRLPERGEELHDPYITLPGQHYLLSRAGPLRASEVYFEAEISRERHLPCYYELEVVRAYPYGLDGRNGLTLEFEVGDEICFRIAE